jgi:hypothetical protein
MVKTYGLTHIALAVREAGTRAAILSTGARRGRSVSTGRFTCSVNRLCRFVRSLLAVRPWDKSVPQANSQVGSLSLDSPLSSVILVK